MTLVQAIGFVVWFAGLIYLTLRSRSCSKKVGEAVWLICRPSYGEFDGLPVAVYRDEQRARTLCTELNSPYVCEGPYRVEAIVLH